MTDDVDEAIKFIFCVNVSLYGNKVYYVSLVYWFTCVLGVPRRERYVNQI